MKHSWTGGQYSLWRALLAIALAVSVGSAASAIAEIEFRIPAILLCLALGLGFYDRLAALLLACAWWGAADRFGFPPTPRVWTISALLLLHAVTHGSPYGTFVARGRVDPAGGWILPRWNFAARRLLVLAAGAAFAARGRLEIPGVLAAALLVSAFDPGWIPPRQGTRATRVFYDGACGLCHRFVRFLLAEDRQGQSFRFAPLQGPTFRAAFPEEVRATYPDSIVVQDDEGRARIRSAAALHALDRLGGFWRALAVIARLVPRPLRDLVYDGIARVRGLVFAKPSDVCPLVPAHLARRFEP